VSIPDQVRLDVHLDPDLPTVRIDESQIQQVVMNLLTNAAEACGDHPGTIRVATRTHLFETGESSIEWVGPPLIEGEYVAVEVVDTGSGIDPVVRDRIFDPFFTTKVAGRGLGLSAVLGIVKKHGGTIGLWSNPGEGTTFCVLLPSTCHRDKPRSTHTASRATSLTGSLVSDQQ
jgi:signal transduction histidine kinase